MGLPDINQSYYNTQQYKNAQAYQNQTINDIAKKYGFNFSRDYANQQAGTIAQGQINSQQAAQRENQSANNINMQRILDDYNGAAKSLDKGYFQQYLNQGQSQVNRGLNGGLAADQNLRLAMNKQGELADVWRTRNLASQEESQRFANTEQRIADALSQIEKERAMNSEKFYQDGLYKGYDILGQDRNYGLQLDNGVWGRYQDMYGNAMSQQQFELQKAQFEWQKQMDEWRKQQAAAEAAAARSRSSSTGGVSATTKQNTSLSNAVSSYNTAVSNQKSPLDKYYTSPAVVAGQRTGSPYFKTPVPPAKNPSLTAWDKLKMLGI